MATVWAPPPEVSAPEDTIQISDHLSCEILKQRKGNFNELLDFHSFDIILGSSKGKSSEMKS